MTSQLVVHLHHAATQHPLADVMHQHHAATQHLLADVMHLHHAATQLPHVDVPQNQLADAKLLLHAVTPVAVAEACLASCSVVARSPVAVATSQLVVLPLHADVLQNQLVVAKLLHHAVATSQLVVHPLLADVQRWLQWHQLHLPLLSRLLPFRRHPLSILRLRFSVSHASSKPASSPALDVGAANL